MAYFSKAYRVDYACMSGLKKELFDQSVRPWRDARTHKQRMHACSYAHARAHTHTHTHTHTYSFVQVSFTILTWQAGDHVASTKKQQPDHTHTYITPHLHAYTHKNTHHKQFCACALPRIRRARHYATWILWLRACWRACARRGSRARSLWNECRGSEVGRLQSVYVHWNDQGDCLQSVHVLRWLFCVHDYTRISTMLYAAEYLFVCVQAHTLYNGCLWSRVS